MTIRTFDINQSKLSIGTHTVTGLADGTSISFKREAKIFEPAFDGQGNTTRIMTNNNNVTLTLTLAMHSPTNDVLSALANADLSTRNGSVPITFRDSLNSTLITSVASSVQEMPDASFGNVDNNREWVIFMADTGYFVGGLGQ